MRLIKPNYPKPFQTWKNNLLADDSLRLEERQFIVNEITTYIGFEPEVCYEGIAIVEAIIISNIRSDGLPFVESQILEIEDNKHMYLDWMRRPRNLPFEKSIKYQKGAMDMYRRLALSAMENKILKFRPVTWEWFEIEIMTLIHNYHFFRVMEYGGTPHPIFNEHSLPNMILYLQDMFRKIRCPETVRPSQWAEQLHTKHLDRMKQVREAIRRADVDLGKQEEYIAQSLFRALMHLEEYDDPDKTACARKRLIDHAACGIRFLKAV